MNAIANMVNMDFQETCLAMLAALEVCLARAAAILAEKRRIKIVNLGGEGVYKPEVYSHA